MPPLADITAIVAVAENGVIGLEGGLPWYLPGDLQRFRELTTGHIVVMGRLTYQSIMRRNGKPLPRRRTIVVSARMRLPVQANVHAMPSLEAALDHGLKLSGDDTRIFVVGGARIFEQAVPLCATVELTRVHGSPAGDASMPDCWLDGFMLTRRMQAGFDPDATHAYTYERYVRNDSPPPG